MITNNAPDDNYQAGDGQFSGPHSLESTCNWRTDPGHSPDTGPQTVWRSVHEDDQFCSR